MLKTGCRPRRRLKKNPSVNTTTDDIREERNRSKIRSLPHLKKKNPNGMHDAKESGRVLQFCLTSSVGGELTDLVSTGNTHTQLVMQCEDVKGPPANTLQCS